MTVGITTLMPLRFLGDHLVYMSSPRIVTCLSQYPLLILHLPQPPPAAASRRAATSRRCRRQLLLRPPLPRQAAAQALGGAKGLHGVNCVGSQHGRVGAAAGQAVLRVKAGVRGRQKGGGVGRCGARSSFVPFQKAGAPIPGSATHIHTDTQVHTQTRTTAPAHIHTISMSPFQHAHAPEWLCCLAPGTWRCSWWSGRSRPSSGCSHAPCTLPQSRRSGRSARSRKHREGRSGP